jgi:hypothetical protein
VRNTSNNQWLSLSLSRLLTRLSLSVTWSFANVFFKEKLKNASVKHIDVPYKLQAKSTRYLLCSLTYSYPFIHCLNLGYTRWIILQIAMLSILHVPAYVGALSAWGGEGTVCMGAGGTTARWVIDDPLGARGPCIILWKYIYTVPTNLTIFYLLWTLSRKDKTNIIIETTPMWSNFPMIGFGNVFTIDKLIKETPQH